MYIPFLHFPHEFQAVEQAITRKCNGVSISTSNLHNAHILQGLLLNLILVQYISIVYGNYKRVLEGVPGTPLFFFLWKCLQVNCTLVLHFLSCGQVCFNRSNAWSIILSTGFKSCAWVNMWRTFQGGSHSNGSPEGYSPAKESADMDNLPP